MQKHSLIAVAVAFLAAACTMAPKYERPAAPVYGDVPGRRRVRDAAGRRRTVGARSANGQAAADIGWRDFFVDPRLQRLIEIALKNNRDLRVSVLNIQAVAGAVPDRARGPVPDARMPRVRRPRQRTPTDLSSLPGQELLTSIRSG